MKSALPDIPGRLSRAAITASLERFLEGWDGAAPVWVFGYGSLIWKPELAFDRRVTARVHGYHRRLCLWSRVNRGTPESPGLVAGLDRGGSCAGVAYRVPGPLARSQLEQLWEREMFMGSYTPRWLRCRLPDGAHEAALAFVVRQDAPNYAGKLSEPDILEVFRRGSCGRFGTSLEYLVNTVRSLHEHGLRDPHLERLVRHAGVGCEPRPRRRT
ncbi:MAG: gamma-glutamylcyclotransferase [Burkholderiaceae bacterium]|jgi:cation transport protein ChaC|nr:gamma-glutamylcyclotransferase [Burkholderiaceae bacterium]MDH5209237.1 gamma-glutamylcyclotransferase [Burkholderiaceae bacterium]